MPYHPFQPQYELAAQVRSTLLAAGFPEGKHHRGGGGYLYRQCVYEPAVPGPVVAVRRIWDHTLAVSGDARVYVDHAGPGRRSALESYHQALLGAGYDTGRAKLHGLASKEFLWVKGKKNATTGTKEAEKQD